MERITRSVGRGGINDYKDTFTIQELINKCIHLLNPLKKLKLDGKVGNQTIKSIELFQKNVLKMVSPDGRVDPEGNTLKILNQKAVHQKILSVSNSFSAQPIKSVKFPLKSRSPLNYKTGMRKFGSNRSQGRKHAGCDLYAPIGTPVYAMDDGEIKNFYAFYLGTYALEVQHPGFYARYGEIGKTAGGIKSGVSVKKGQLLGYVGELKGLNMSMLHLELYSGSATGPLTVRGNKPYQRRSDLIDPTPILDAAGI
jgi:murein DD-endopeptidase MepM/ murein hydrolase activator NlpD